MARAGKHLSPGEIHEPLPAVSHANQHVVSFLMLGQLSCEKGLPLKRDCHFGARVQALGQPGMVWRRMEEFKVTETT